MRRYEFSDSTSKEFWEVDVKGKILYITFGKIGTEKQSEHKYVIYDTHKIAINEMEKLILEKTNKGYVEAVMVKDHNSRKSKEVLEKVNKFFLMIKNGAIEPAIQFLLGCKDESIYEVILEGSSIDDVKGCLIPGPILKKSRTGSEVFGLITLFYFPDNVKLPKGLSKKKIKVWYYKKGYLDIFGKYVVPKAPWIELSRLNDRKHNFYKDVKLGNLNNACAEGLTAIRDALSLKGSSVSDSLAKIICRFKTFSLWLIGVKSLSDSAAKSLSKFKGHLVLNELETISDSPGHLALAKKLSKAPKDCDLNLNGLKNLSESIAKVLIKYKGELCLCGLKSVSDKVANILSTKPNVWLDEEIQHQMKLKSRDPKYQMKFSS